MHARASVSAMDAFVLSASPIVCVIVRVLTRLGADEPLVDSAWSSWSVAGTCLFIYQYLLSFAVCFTALALLEPLSTGPDIGLLVVMFDRMLDDLKSFLLLFVVCALAFTFSFLGLEWVGAMQTPREQQDMLIGQNICDLPLRRLRLFI